MDWKNYNLLVICCMFYTNVMGTTVVPSEYMDATSSGTRVIIYTPSADKSWEVYKASDSSLYLKAGTADSTTGVRIYGIGKIS